MGYFDFGLRRSHSATEDKLLPGILEASSEEFSGTEMAVRSSAQSGSLWPDDHNNNSGSPDDYASFGRGWGHGRQRVLSRMRSLRDSLKASFRRLGPQRQPARMARASSRVRQLARSASARAKDLSGRLSVRMWSSRRGWTGMGASRGSL